jgi:hypothetical protein
METVRERLLGILAASLLLAGCVSLTPQQRAKVDEIQSFADRTTKVYDLPGVRISIQPATNLNIGAMSRARPERQLPRRMAACPGATGARRQRQGGRDPGSGEWHARREAVQTVAEALQRAQRATERSAPLTPGHLTPAEELADLRARFPEAR